MSHGGEQVFLQCDFEREARRFLRALGGCLAASGYQEQRISEHERQMVTRGEYRLSADPEGVKLVVQLGAVSTTDIAQRHDHMLLAAFVRGNTEEEEGAQGLPIQIGPPIHLSAGAYAQQLLAALNRPLRPSDKRTPTRDSRKPRRAMGQDDAQDQLVFF